MNSKKYWGVAIALVPVLVFLVAMAIVLNNKNNIVDDEDWTNFDELSAEFLDRYFDEYADMRSSGDPDNILMVTSKTRPDAYGASKIVEAPDYLYFLQYDSVEEREAAFSKFEVNGVRVERNQKMQLMGDYLSWGIEKMDLDGLMDRVKSLDNPEEVWVSVIDTGINMETFGAAFPNRTVYARSMINDHTDVEDRHADKHGTHIAGTIAEWTPDNVNILVIKVSDTVDGTDINTADVASAVYFSRTQNAKVINMSLGSPDASNTLKDKLDSAGDAGIINVASAGNFNTDVLFYPASFDSVISVAAVNSNLERWVESENLGSNYGEKIEFAAPGKTVLGINGYAMMGTSMAAPHIAAAVANLKSFDADIDLDYTREALKANAIDLGDEGWDEYYGWGFVDFTNAAFCDGTSHCDKYGIFETDWTLTDKTKGGAAYNVDGDIITVTSAQPAMIVIKYDDVYTRLPAVATANADTYTFDLDGTNDNAKVWLFYVGDVSMNGKVTAADSLTIDYSLLSKKNENYYGLNELQMVIADTSKNNKVTAADSLLVDYSLLSTDNVNYRALNW